MPEFLTKCVGLHFRPRETKDFVAENLSGGDTLTLEREPENAYDSNAIKVIATDDFGCDWHIGYIPKEDNSVLAMLMDSGDIEPEAKVLSAGDKIINLIVRWAE